MLVSASSKYFYIFMSISSFRYNLLTRNCEHFARWCKTGKEQSQQAKSFFRTVLERFSNGLDLQMQAAVKFTACAVKTAVDAESGAIVTAAAKDVSSKQVTNAASSFISPLKAAGAVFVVCAEVRMLLRDVKNAADQRRKGHITRKEFIKITVKRTVECAGSLCGAAVAFAIPLLNNALGITLGTLIGQGLGSLIGRQMCAAIDKLAA